MNLEKALFDSIARVSIEDRVDQYWNTHQSLLYSAMSKYFYDNKEKIAEEVIKKLWQEYIVNELSNKIIEQLMSRRYDISYSADDLKKKTMEKLAEKLAEVEFLKYKKDE